MNATSAASELLLIVGDATMQRICDAFGGQSIYIPQRVPDFARDHRVWLEFNEVIHSATSVGSAYVQVGEMEGLAPRTIRSIICGN